MFDELQIDDMLRGEAGSPEAGASEHGDPGGNTSRWHSLGEWFGGDGHSTQAMLSGSSLGVVPSTPTRDLSPVRPGPRSGLGSTHPSQTTPEARRRQC